MASITNRGPVDSNLPPMRVRVLGPDAAEVSEEDLKRLFKGRHLTPARRHHLADTGRVLAACGARIVGLAGYERIDGEFRVHEFGLDEASPGCLEEIATALLDALETACLAGGGKRLVLLPRASVDAGFLRQRGYAPIAEDCAGSWFVKRFSS
jgi:hypothetical protein